MRIAGNHALSSPPCDKDAQGPPNNKDLYENKFHKWFGSGKRSASDPNPVVLFVTGSINFLGDSSLIAMVCNRRQAAIHGILAPLTAAMTIMNW